MANVTILTQVGAYSSVNYSTSCTNPTKTFSKSYYQSIGICDNLSFVVCFFLVHNFDYLRFHLLFPSLLKTFPFHCSPPQSQPAQTGGSFHPPADSKSHL